MINWKLRVMNRTTWAGIIAAVTACVYQILGLVGVVPPVSQDAVVQVLGLILNVLVAVGVIVDPTTEGIADSERAMGYDKPYPRSGKDAASVMPTLFDDGEVVEIGNSQ